MFILNRIIIVALLFAAAAASAKPLKVFILVGQSNMQGHAHVRTFDHLGMDRDTRPLLRAIRGAGGKPRVCKDVWISSLSNGGEKHGRLTAGFGANESKIGPDQVEDALDRWDLA